MLVTNLIYLPLLFVNCGTSSTLLGFHSALHSSQHFVSLLFGNCPAIDFISFHFSFRLFYWPNELPKSCVGVGVCGGWCAVGRVDAESPTVIYWYNFVIKMKTFTIRISSVLFMSSSSQPVGCCTLGNLFNCRHPRNGDWDIYSNMYKRTFERMRSARLSWTEKLLTLWRNGNLDKLSTDCVKVQNGF